MGQFAQGAPITKVMWFMTGALYEQFVHSAEGTKQMKTVYFINLRDIGLLRTRSCK